MSKRRNVRRKNDTKQTKEVEGMSKPRAAANDVSWYTRYPQLTAASAAIPYPYRPGMRVNMSSRFGNGMAYVVPGVMSIDWTPSIGTSENSTDPASLVARELYTKVRSSFSSSLDAQAPDFVIYLTCLDSIFSYIATLKRIYRTLVAYNPDNYATPDVLLSAMGLSEWERDFLSEHRTEFFGIINELILMVRKFRCPGEFDIFNRHYWMNDKVFSDDASLNSQFYVFRQAYYYQYKELKTPHGVPAAGASTVKSPFGGTNSNTVNVAFSFGKRLIQSLSDWDDAYTINGYLERAFMNAPYFTVDDLQMDETLDISYEPEVLLQIENIHTLQVAGSETMEYNNLEISQDPLTNSIIYKPIVRLAADGDPVTRGMDTLNPVLNVRSPAPTLVDTIVASRLHVNINIENAELDDGNYQYSVVCGTELPGAITIWRNEFTQKDSTYGWVSHKPFYSYIYSTGNLTDIIDIAAFDWHPQVYLFNDDDEYKYVVPVFDVHNITTMNQAALANIHRVCVLSEWNAFNA